MVAYPAANISFTPPLLSFIYLFADPDLSWKSTCLFVNQEGVILFRYPRVKLDFYFFMMTERGRISRWHLWFLPSDITWDYVRGRFSAKSCQSKEFSFAEDTREKSETIEAWEGFNITLLILKLERLHSGTQRERYFWWMAWKTWRSLNWILTTM